VKQLFQGYSRYMGIKQRLTEQFDQLSPQLKTAAVYVSRHPEEVVNQSLRKVAEASGVSPPTFSRLARALGLDSYEAMRALCLETVSEQQRTFGEKARALQQYEQGNSSQHKGTFVVAQAASAIDNIQHMVERLEPDKLSAAADLLVAAPAVYIAGGQSSRPFADYLGYMSSMAFSHWEVLDGDKPIGVTLNRLNTSGVLIVISMRPFSSRVVELAELAVQAGLQIIVLTDCDVAPLSKNTEFVFNAATDSPQFFSSYAATLVLLESLMAMVIRRGGEDVQKRIEQVEALNHKTGEYCWESAS